MTESTKTRGILPELAAKDEAAREAVRREMQERGVEWAIMEIVRLRRGLDATRENLLRIQDHLDRIGGAQ